MLLYAITIFITPYFSQNKQHLTNINLYKECDIIYNSMIFMQKNIEWEFINNFINFSYQ
jgi:hypothetical protein